MSPGPGNGPRAPKLKKHDQFIRQLNILAVVVRSTPPPTARDHFLYGGGGLIVPSLQRPKGFSAAGRMTPCPREGADGLLVLARGAME
eukprot:2742684-Pyramimonas_sp.AAC.1